VLSGLARLMKDGRLSRLDAIILEANPDRARELGVRNSSASPAPFTPALLALGLAALGVRRRAA
jgi:uncharacterized protein (TIGR03382 family)